MCRSSFRLQMCHWGRPLGKRRGGLSRKRAPHKGRYPPPPSVGFAETFFMHEQSQQVLHGGTSVLNPSLRLLHGSR